MTDQANGGRQDLGYDATIALLRAQRERKVDAVLLEGTHMDPVVAVDGDQGEVFPAIQFDAPAIPRLGSRWLPIRRQAHRQLAERIGHGMRMEYYDAMLQECPDLWAQTVRTWWGKDPRNRLVRSFVDANGDSGVRAMLSDQYRIMDTLPFLEVVLDEAHRRGAEPESAHLDEERCYMKLVRPSAEVEVEPGRHQTAGVTLRQGISISNSEVGSGKINVDPFCVVLECWNGLVSVHSLGRVHLGGKLDVGILQEDTIRARNIAVWKEVRDLTIAAFDTDNLRLFADSLQRTMGVTIGDQQPRAAVANIVDRLDLTREEGRSVLDRFLVDAHQTGETQFGLVQAVTRIAQEAPSYARQVQVEEAGSKLLEMGGPEFGRLVAAKPSEKTVEALTAAA